MIINETCNVLKEKLGNTLDKLCVSDVRIGLYLSAVKLSNNNYGVAGSLLSNDIISEKKNRDFGAFTPNQIIGQKVIDLLETEKESNIIATLKIAVLNALSYTFLEYGNYKILKHTDPVDLIDLNQNKTITIVGAFQSYINKISQTNNTLYVLEYKEDALSEVQKKHFVPASLYKEVIPQSDIVVITGSTLVNNTIDKLLEAVKTGTQTIVTGPSGNILPDVLFNNKVTHIGATRIRNFDNLFSIVGEGGAGYHLFKYGAEKICIVNDN